VPVPESSSDATTAAVDPEPVSTCTNTSAADDDTPMPALDAAGTLSVYRRAWCGDWVLPLFHDSQPAASVPDRVTVPAPRLPRSSLQRPVRANAAVAVVGA